MPSIQTAEQILDRHYLEIRCGILDIAAALDRVDRAQGASQVAEDTRRQKLQQGLEILLSSGTDRAERVQLLFSDDYQPGWNRKDR